MEQSETEIKRMFTIPFTQISNKVIDNYTVFKKPIDKLMYISLLKFSFQKGYAFPSIKTLSKINMVTDKTARGSLQRLEENKLIKIEKRMEGKKHLSNVYYIYDIPENKESGTVKIPVGVGEKLRGGTVKIPYEEEELNNKNYNNNKYLSKEEEIELLEIPMQVKKQLVLNKRRLIDDSISIDSIANLYLVTNDEITTAEFSHILNNALKSKNGPIRDLINYMQKSVKNHIADNLPAQNDVTNQSNEVLPDWFTERKRKQEAEEHEKNRGSLK